ncbi:MAG: hypothetical protein FWG87_11240 [Defluviitaleaceae bacterium]|nr:hypothetical protein [Defluviitaleaceae bacterium]
MNGEIFPHEPIRKIRVNPLNPCLINHLLNHGLRGLCRFFVGDGFIRPEVRTFYNSGQVTSIKQAVRCCLSGFLRQHRTPTNAERGNLGADKSAPYKDRYRVFSHERIRENPLNPRKSAFHALTYLMLVFLQFAHKKSP